MTRLTVAAFWSVWMLAAAAAGVLLAHALAYAVIAWFFWAYLGR